MATNVTDHSKLIWRITDLGTEEFVKEPFKLQFNNDGNDKDDDDGKDILLMLDY